MNPLYIVAGVLVVLGAPMVVRNYITPRSVGITDGALSEVPRSPNGVSSQTDVTGKRVDPLPFQGSVEETRQALLAAAESFGTYRLKTDEGTYLHLVFITPVMRFRDDVEFLLDEEAQVVHLRSASRVGHSDMGLNRRRYEAIRQHYLGGEDRPGTG